MPLQGAVDVVPWLGAIAGCHSGVLWLQGGGDDQLWGSGRSAIAGCHCRVPLSVSYLPPIFRATNVTQTPNQENNNEFCLELLADVTLFSTLITQKNCFLLSGVYAGIIFFKGTFLGGLYFGLLQTPSYIMLYS